jgi:cysteine desulfurase
LFHTDAAHAFGKIPWNVEEFGIDLMSITAHKIYGPIGIGALYVRRKPKRVRIQPLFHGGGQERGLRSGTLSPALIAGFGKAAEIAEIEMEKDAAHVKKLFDILYKGIFENLKDVHLNGSLEKRYYGNANISFAYIEGESLLMGLKDLAVSSGSACTSSSLESSYVLKALGLSEELAHTSIRFGFGRFTREEEINEALKTIKSSVDRLRELSPLWEMVQEGIDLETIQWSDH